MTIGPLAHVPVDPSIAALPKADLHLHQEAMPRLERLAARRRGRSAYDWRAHARRVLDGTPPGFGRLTAIYAPDSDLDLGGAPASDPENFVAMVVDILEEGTAAGAGLGITVHAGEFSPANLAAALGVPGLSRLGHAVYAASDPRLLEQLAASGATVECSLTCNVILGAAPSYEAHPIRRFVESGIPVTLNTDLPVHACTTIGREYAIAAALGFSPAELLGFTRNAVRASFTSAERRAALLDELRGWEATLPAS